MEKTTLEMGKEGEEAECGPGGRNRKTDFSGSVPPPGSQLPEDGGSMHRSSFSKCRKMKEEEKAMKCGQ